MRPPTERETKKTCGTEGKCDIVDSAYRSVGALVGARIEAPRAPRGLGEWPGCRSKVSAW